ncbi:magnesium transporter [Candidatus Sumerlaeota bacterium]|nr:magnesium transporter [Candidatus Sumerlaeota bacterium]
MLGKALQEDIVELIRARELDPLREAFGSMSAADVAEILEDLPTEFAAVVFRVLPQDVAGETFASMGIEQQKDLVQGLSKETLASVLNGMPPDDRTRLLEELPAEVTRAVVDWLTPEERRIAQQLLNYPDESVGRLMTPDYVRLPANVTVAEALQIIRDTGMHTETVNLVYVVDEKGRLLDDLKLREVVMANPDSKIEDLIDHQFVSLKPTDDQEEVIPLFKKYYRVALPVVSSNGTMLGIVTLDDVLAVAEEEATEDIQQMGGMEALDEPYLATPLPQLIKKRAGWLLVLFLGEMLTASAMANYEDEFKKAAVLTLFIPLIISSGGNSGSQAATLIIRALSVGEIGLHDWFRVLRRELFSGVILGSILGMVGFIRIALWTAFSDVYGEHWILIGLTVWIALVGVVLWGTMSGGLLPIMLKRLGLDPATSSAPFVATLVDVTGLIIYFSVASIVLRGTLL